MDFSTTVRKDSNKSVRANIVIDTELEKRRGWRSERDASFISEYWDYVAVFGEHERAFGNHRHRDDSWLTFVGPVMAAEHIVALSRRRGL